jgi:hypothetical protein
LQEFNFKIDWSSDMRPYRMLQHLIVRKSDSPNFTAPKKLAPFNNEKLFLD